MVLTVGDPNPTAYDLSTVWLPDTGACATVGYTEVNFWGGPPNWGNDPDFSTKWNHDWMVVESNGVYTWTPSLPLSSDRRFAGTFTWTYYMRDLNPPKDV